MPCLRCGSEFGIFKKESFCRNCGFSYCGGCLTKKVVVPKLGSDSKHSVCHKCFNLLSNGKSEGNTNREPPSPPAALQKRMEAANASRSSPLNNNPSYSNSKDSVLASRLENIRSDRIQGPVPSLSQLEERLARLKGSQIEGSAVPPVSSAERPVSTEDVFVRRGCEVTPAEEARHLFHQITAEVALDSSLPRPEDEIRTRLERLRSNDDLLNDLNKQPAEANTNVGGIDLTSPPSTTVTQNQKPPPLPPSSFEISDSVDPEVLQVWQYMVEAEKEACQEAEEALRLQEKDKELKVKLDEIRANRDTVKRIPSSKLPNGDFSDEDNEDKHSDKVIQQFLNEARLEAADSAPLRSNGNANARRRAERKLINSSDQDDTDDSEELPWCAICNNDASLRCYGCEGDLYCRRCFRECHDTQELKEHPSTVYEPKATNGH